MNLILLGPPGAGKGTQGAIIQERQGLLKISTGDLVREEIAQGSELGKLIQKIVESGQFPTDEIVMDMVDKKLQLGSKGWIFDGVPRTQYQAEMLDVLLTQLNKKIDAVIAFKVDEKKLQDRITTRYTCVKCGKIYSKFIKPQQEGVCDYCGSSDFVHRTDDSAETLRTRLSIYHEKTEPLVAFYKNKGVFYEVDGMGEVKDVTRQIEGIIRSLPHDTEVLERKGVMGIDF